MAKAPPPPAEAAANLVSGAAANSQKYATRAVARANEWAAQAGAAGQTWLQGTTQAGPARYTAGIRGAGAAGYAEGIQAKGTTRYAPGVQAGQNKYAARVARYFQVIAGTQLPARGIRGAAGNLQRVAAISNALNAARVGGQAARSG